MVWMCGSIIAHRGMFAATKPLDKLLGQNIHGIAFIDWSHGSLSIRTRFRPLHPAPQREREWGQSSSVGILVTESRYGFENLFQARQSPNIAFARGSGLD